jgi:hypothetical protein
MHVTEGASENWSTRPGSRARAASRRAPCASRAKLGREPEKHATVSDATPTLATCSDPWISLRFPAKPPQGAALGTPA